MSTSKQGWLGALVVVIGAAWWMLNIWQAFDFLLGRMTLLAALLDSVWGPIVLMAIGFGLLFRLVYTRLPVSQAEVPPELEIRQRQHEQDALDKYIAEMRQRLENSDGPLDQLPPDHPDHKSAQEDTTRILSRLSPDGKREVVSFLHGRDLIKVGGPIISLVRADLSSANLSDLGLREAELSYANLRDADLSGAGLCDYLATGADKMRLLERGTPQRTFSEPINVSHLIWSDLSGAVLRRARLGGCIFHSADFAGADLDQADLWAADLRRARNLTQEQIEKAYGSKGQQDVRDTLLPGNVKAPKQWEWPLTRQQAMRQSKS